MTTPCLASASACRDGCCSRWRVLDSQYSGCDVARNLVHFVSAMVLDVTDKAWQYRVHWMAEKQWHHGELPNGVRPIGAIARTNDEENRLFPFGMRAIQAGDIVCGRVVPLIGGFGDDDIGFAWCGGALQPRYEFGGVHDGGVDWVTIRQRATRNATGLDPRGWIMLPPAPVVDHVLRQWHRAEVPLGECMANWCYTRLPC